ncbi:MAG: hypothetical protein JNM72_10230 [Deltaproteobacteria bacterium]|nr:hypothetical protein [Deltaproteobacteria bacterium]
MSAARVAVTGLGLVCPLGAAFNEQVAVLAARLAAGERALRPHPPLAQLPDGGLAGVVGALDLDRFLLRRKDKKLLARPSALALACAGPLVSAYPGDRRELALYLGVGREPPDDGESEATLALSARDGLLDEGLLAGPGRDRYPPLLPLKTLPNMAPAHISINLGLMGENAAWAGVWGAGLLALRAGLRAVAEGRAPAALVGGADSRVDLGSARDRLRVGEEGAPAEGAALLLLEPEAEARSRGAKVYGWLVEADPAELGAIDARGVNIDQMGDLGAAAAPVAAVLALCGDRPRAVWAADPGLPALAVGVRPDTAC